MSTSAAERASRQTADGQSDGGGEGDMERTEESYLIQIEKEDNQDKRGNLLPNSKPEDVIKEREK